MIVESSPKLPAWRRAVSNAVVEAMEASGDLNKFDEAVKVEAVFYLTRPKTVSRAYPSKPPDVDKLARGLLDGMLPCWVDDSLVVRLEVSKVYATGQSGVAVTVTKYP
jgi:Holliday junction resolvase RusA-like endonuclease